MSCSKFKNVMKPNIFSSYQSQVTCSNSFCPDCFPQLVRLEKSTTYNYFLPPLLFPVERQLHSYTGPPAFYICLTITLILFIIKYKHCLSTKINILLLHVSSINLLSIFLFKWESFFYCFRRIAQIWVFKYVKSAYLCMHNYLNYNEVFKIYILIEGNYCQGVLCQNNGICIPEEHEYYCYCLAGFSGDKYQTGIDVHLPSI